MIEPEAIEELHPVAPAGAVQDRQVEIVALCDAVVSSSRPGSGSFPDVHERRWRGARELHPELYANDGGWRFHVHVYVVRSEGRTFLLDTGIGPASAPAHAWTGIAGSLPTELADAGVDFRPRSSSC